MALARRADGTAPPETDYLGCLARLAGGTPPG